MTSPAESGLQRAADHRLQALAAEPRRADARAALDQPVGVEQQRPAVRAADGRPRPTPRPSTTPSGGPTRPGSSGTIARSAISSGGGWPASRIRAVPPIGRDRDHAERGEHPREVALDLVHDLQRRQHVVHRVAAEHERAPGDPQADAERGGVGPVAGDVADHGVDGAVGHLHRVVEVAAQQRAPAARAVVRGQLQRGIADQRGRQQAALEAGVLLGVQACDLELLARLVRAPALDRVADRARQSLPVDLALDQVVLRARRRPRPRRAARRRSPSARARRGPRGRP